ncbi:hypothetical protein [Paenisporosarcina indica]|uniref:hypothetical protein n=1 Tax=Paenisporosarcina indica TaxID=650093 RepID=UPI000950227B|nr:hypothetical protein [Paenisporosarcina indica]
MYLLLKRVITTILVVVLITGCGVSEKQKVSLAGTASPKEVSQSFSEFSLIESVGEDRILIGSTYYTISEKTKMEKSNKEKLTIDELHAGDLVNIEDEGYILESFPGQGFATSVVLQNDIESLKVSESIRHFFENQETGNILSTTIEDVTEQSIILHFFEWEIHGKKYEAEIDRADNSFNVKEIVNEQALEQERRNKEMAAAHPEGSTSGHITEIYDNGFRINMADYIFAEDIQFNNDLGDKLIKDQFRIGSFVSVDYDKLEYNSTIGKGILSNLTLLTKEENPEVREWIEMIMTGDLYEQPVVMMSYTNHEQSYYAIRVADLKDDTRDTFEMKYDIGSGTHETTVNKE